MDVSCMQRTNLIWRCVSSRDYVPSQEAEEPESIETQSYSSEQEPAVSDEMHQAHGSDIPYDDQ